MKKDCWFAAKGGAASSGKGGHHDKKGKGKGSHGQKQGDDKKVKRFKCGNVGHYAKDCKSVSSLDNKAAANTKIDEAFSALFLTALEVPRTCRPWRCGLRRAARVVRSPWASTAPRRRR